ncbi:MAG: transcription termination factor Rho [Lachnospiraceae bacterium]|nr:transcription termination factor Rho [Lachnospiraceae bacterium]
MREKYETLSAAALKELAKARGIKSVSAMKKSEVIEAMLAEDEKEAKEKKDQGNPVNTAQPTAAADKNIQNGENVQNSERRTQSSERTAQNGERSAQSSERTAQNSERTAQNGERSAQNSERTTQNGERSDQNGERNTQSSERSDRPPVDLAQLDSGNVASGILEVMPDGYGFIRSDNYLPGENDVYVSPSQIRRFGLKTGDIISGNTRIKAQQEKFSALLFLKTINGMSPAEASRRYNFEDMTPIFPNQRLRMERYGSKNTAMRIVDLISPIGKGQRGMIVSPPKAGKTTLLKDVAKSILQNDKNMTLIILLIDERPEEVTDIREAIVGDNVEVIYSTFDELPEHHKRVSEMGIERAKRLVEHKKDVTILLDSITRLARAYNLTVPPSGRTLSGGLDPAALHMPKRFFGAARKMREGGSLTILATALVDTGSKMDDVVYEEFKGTGNMELVLDRKLSERRVFPAIDIQKSGTRREDLLLDAEEQEAVYIMRKALNGMKSDDAVENILNMFVHTKDNRELVARVRRQKFI